jgi:hypothetical protein
VRHEGVVGNEGIVPIIPTFGVSCSAGVIDPDVQQIGAGRASEKLWPLRKRVKSVALLGKWNQIPRLSGPQGIQCTGHDVLGCR